MSKRTNANKKTQHIENAEAKDAIDAQTLQHAEEAQAPSTKVNAPGDGQRRVEPIILSDAQKEAMKGLTTWSAKIRFLHAEKFSRGQIAVFLNKKYQHVRNVLITPLKKPEPSKTINTVEA